MDAAYGYRTPVSAPNSAAHALPNLVVIGAMKCGTTALHRLLDHHPDIAMAAGKELNFFFGPASGPDPSGVSTWHLGPDWYARRFDGRAAIRGESSPGYTSPDHREVAGRMADLVPEAHLVYLVRDPLDRAVSQYRHHRAEGAESRPIAEALPDPASQYIARSRYHDRLTPFLRHFQIDQIVIIDQADLLRDTARCLRRVHRFLGVAPAAGHLPPGRRWNASTGAEVAVPQRVREALRHALADDVARLRELTGQEFGRWSV